MANYGFADLRMGSTDPSKMETAELSIGPNALTAYSRLSYTMWFALAEFVDNSTQSRKNYGGIIDEVLRGEGQPLTVDIIHNRIEREILINDNSIGMSKNQLIEALRIAYPTKDSIGRSKYGMGMKTAAIWIGNYWTVTTCEWGSGEEWTAIIDVNAVANGNTHIPLSMKKVSTDSHYTKICIKNLHRVIQKRSEETIKLYLGSIYTFDLQPNKEGECFLKLTYNGEEVKAPNILEWDTDVTGRIMRQELTPLTIGAKKITGWFGVLRKGGRKFGGFSLFQSYRQIQGFPNAWKPKSIFGGVDDEGANNLVAQRLTGVLLLEGFTVSHTKDAILFEDDEEDILEKYLIDSTKSYVDYAKSRRRDGTSEKWTKEKIKEIALDLKDEFNSPEMKDAVIESSLPPDEVLEKNIQDMVKGITPDEILAKYEIDGEFSVIVSYKEISEWEPHVSFSIGSDRNVLYIIINGLHSYYKTMESQEAIDECIRQYVYDVISEYKVCNQKSRINPDSVRFIKSQLLRAKLKSIQNSDEDIREKATEELFK